MGLVERRDFVIEFALPQRTSQVPGAAAELVRRGVDILLASGTPSVLPARDAAGQIPIVFVATFDPVATGLVASLARPACTFLLFIPTANEFDRSPAWKARPTTRCFLAPMHSS